MSQKGKFTVIKFDNSAGTPVDISTSVMESNGLPLTYDELEESGYTEDHSQLKGQADSTPTLMVQTNTTTNPIFIDESTGALKSDTARTLTIEYGDNAAPTTGDINVSGEYLVTSIEFDTAKDGVRVMNVTLRLSGGSAPTFGTVA